MRIHRKVYRETFIFIRVDKRLPDRQQRAVGQRTLREGVRSCESAGEDFDFA